jgi:hypothetical protein
VRPSTAPVHDHSGGQRVPVLACRRHDRSGHHWSVDRRLSRRAIRRADVRPSLVVSASFGTCTTHSHSLATAIPG